MKRVVITGMGGFTSLQALNTGTDKKRASIPFDKERSGFVMGEGAGVLVLEEYEHAKKRGAKIYAEIIGYGANCDAHHMTAPLEDGSGAAACMELALQEGGVKQARFRRQVVPGDVLTLSCEIITRKGPIGIGKAVALLEGKPAITAELTFAIEEKS